MENLEFQTGVILSAFFLCSLSINASHKDGVIIIIVSCLSIVVMQILFREFYIICTIAAVVMFFRAVFCLRFNQFVDFFLFHSSNFSFLICAFMMIDTSVVSIEELMAHLSTGSFIVGIVIPGVVAFICVTYGRNLTEKQSEFFR